MLKQRIHIHIRSLFAQTLLIHLLSGIYIHFFYCQTFCRQNLFSDIKSVINWIRTNWRYSFTVGPFLLRLTVYPHVWMRMTLQIFSTKTTRTVSFYHTILCHDLAVENKQVCFILFVVHTTIKYLHCCHLKAFSIYLYFTRNAECTMYCK